MGLQAQIAHQRGAHLLTVRGSFLTEILGDGVADLGVLYGRVDESDRKRASISAGLALVLAEDCPGGLSSGSCDEVLAIGLPVVGEMSFIPVHFLGFGLQAFANLNLIQSSLGAAFLVQVGSLSQKR